MNVLTKLSFTKLTFFMVILVLCVTTAWVVFTGRYDELTKTVLSFFGTALVSMTSFYFGQKTSYMNKEDALVKDSTNGA